MLSDFLEYCSIQTPFIPLPCIHSTPNVHCTLYMFEMKLLHSFTILHQIPLQGDNQLLRGFSSRGGYAGGIVCHDFQCIRGTIGKVDVWDIHVRRVEQLRCLLLYGKHPSFVLYFRGQVRTVVSYFYKYRLGSFEDNCVIQLCTFLPTSFLSSPQVLRYSATSRLPSDHDSFESHSHAGYCVDLSSTSVVRANFCRMVHHERKP